MKTLIIYDNTGFVYITQSGAYTVPNGGIQYLEYEVPLDKRVDRVDKNTLEPILIDMPKGETEILRDEITQLKEDMADLMFEILMGGI